MVEQRRSGFVHTGTNLRVSHLPAAEVDCQERSQRCKKQTVDLWITDGNQAMLSALKPKFPAAARQRRVKHKMENVLSYAPEKRRDQVEPALKTIVCQESREKADQEVIALCEKYTIICPTATSA